MKKILSFASVAIAALLMAACSEDFKDWEQQQPYAAEEAITIPGFTATAAAAVDLNTVGDSVKLLTLSDATLPAGTSLDHLRIVVTPADVTGDAVTINAYNATGMFPVAALQDAVVGYYGLRPVARTLNAHAYVDVMRNGEASFVDAGTLQLTVTPQAPELESAYYVTGNINGWDNNNTDYELTNGGKDPYEQPVFTATVPAPADGGNLEFKLTPKSGLGGDWSKCIAAAGEAGKFNYNNDGGNLVVEAVADAKFYVLSFDMLDKTWSAQALPGIEEAYYLVGTMNGWDINNTDFELSNGGLDPYEQPVFSILLPADKVGSELKFKVAPKSGVGDWNKCLAATETPGVFAANNAGGDFVGEVVDGALFYRIAFNMLTFTYEIKAVNFKQFVYFIGATDGWKAADQKLESPSFDGIYTGYVYVADPNGWGLEFKLQQTQGSWDDQLNSNNIDVISGDFEKGSDNIKASAGEGLYYVTLNLGANTLNAVKITNMNLVGQFNGWNPADDAQQMTWDAENYCYVITGAAVTADGWKFTANNEWAINLGGDINSLEANGANISVTGSTIKLYPTRKTSNNIYCTVE